MKFVDDFKKAYRWISIQCMAAAVGIQTAWETVPPDLKANFTEQQVRWVTVGLLVFGILGRLVKQRKP